MVNPIAWIDAKSIISKTQAESIAASLGGRLLVHSEPADLTRLADLADREEIRPWYAATPANTSSQISQLLVEFTNGRVNGTVEDDLFFGAQGHQLLKAGAGNDIYFGGAAGGTIDLGSGNDILTLGETLDAPPWTNFAPLPGTLIFDGDGADYIDAPAGIVQASIDGDNDTFANLSKVTFKDAQTDLSVSGGVATGGGVGADSLINVTEVVGGRGNDTMSGFARLIGNAGNDVLRPGGLVSGSVSPNAYAAFADGGDGNDVLYTSSLARAELRGGNGNDKLILSNGATVSGGAGTDEFIFTAVAPVTINDWTSGDKLDFSNLLDGSVADAFEDEFLSLRVVKGYTQLSIDPDGGADAFVLAANLKGAFPMSTLDDWIVI